jgi:excisionase family DNA binding protein
VPPASLAAIRASCRGALSHSNLSKLCGPSVRAFSAISRKGVKQVRNSECGARNGNRAVESRRNAGREVEKGAQIGVGEPLRLLTRTELAERLGVSSRTVDRMLADREITPVILRSRLVRFYLPDVVRQLVARALVSKRGCARKLDPSDVVRTSAIEPQKAAQAAQGTKGTDRNTLIQPRNTPNTRSK